jgi:hypothetical protein
MEAKSYVLANSERNAEKYRGTLIIYGLKADIYYIKNNSAPVIPIRLAVAR